MRKGSKELSLLLFIDIPWKTWYNKRVMIPVYRAGRAGMRVTGDSRKSVCCGGTPKFIARRDVEDEMSAMRKE